MEKPLDFTSSSLFLKCSLVNSEFKSRANSWIRYAIRRNVEEVDLWLFDVGVGQDFTFEDELFFNTSCITHDNMIGKIISGSPCLESMELKEIAMEDIMRLYQINAPYISSLPLNGLFFLRELVLLNVSSLLEVYLKYSISYKEFVIFAEEIFRGLLKSLGHVENITFGDHCSELKRANSAPPHLCALEKMNYDVASQHYVCYTKSSVCACRELCEGMSAAGSFDEVIEGHEAYLLSSQLQCFLVPNKLVSKFFFLTGFVSVQWEA
ncbi:hypothetical protein Tco_0730772 [Tanacetum coccineum]